MNISFPTAMFNLIISILILISCAQQDDKYSKSREVMVTQQIEKRGIVNQATISSMKKVPRQKFVPPNIIERAYDDGPLPIGYGQTISASTAA